MRRSPGIHRSTASVDRPVIMRLITTASLALLLLFALTATAHGDAGENGAAPSLAAASIEAFDDAVAVGDAAAVDSTAAVENAAAVDQDQTPAALPATGMSALAGAAVCILGVLCGLAAMLLLSRVLRRPGQLSTLREKPHARPSAPASPVHPRVTAISLIQLGLSRT
ncbi:MULTISPECIES: hypothetical protein [unclassified Microbacterium]|uniref:hypothetical protein n=1 Tax=unclassified Microbacterium TaxID=2609290 RepID=UPI0011B0AD19|nr:MULTISPECIES: hypothetical protein [unclassified Microbacterium]